jgi:prophage endopeptidase
VVFLWHDASVSRIELKQAQEKAQATLEQSIVVTQADAKASKELSDAKAVTDDLSRRLAAGSTSLRVGASCVPVASGAGMASRTTAVLDRESESAYLAHRELIQRKDAQIKGLQGIIRGLAAGSNQ